MEFPHLKDTRFPNLDNVNVYSFKNDFDYSRWIPNTQIRLVNVLWNSDYADVVKFDDNEARDKWFDEIEDNYEIILTSNARVLPDGQIKLPIPFDVAATYNYLFIDFKYATSSEHRIDYESSHGILRWYFFVDSIEYAAPNTTVFRISLDIWTNYINNVYIRYMVLERGHAPVAYTDVDEYLSNPIENNKYLLAPDVNFGKASVCHNSTFIPFGNGIKYVCFASTVTPALFNNIGSITADSDYTVENITYSDINIRWGYQLEVHGFGIGDGYDYSSVRTPAAIGTSNGDRIANNLSVYAIPASECYGTGTFFNDILTTSPSFLNTIQGCFVVDENMIVLGTSHTLANHTIYEVVGKEQALVDDLSLSKEDFNLPEKYANYAKLYTYPYSYIEITDNNGKTVEVKIEETSTVKCKSVVSLAFPYINSRIYFDGIGGTGYSLYSWVDLASVSTDKEMSNSSWFNYCFDMNIPCYALYADGETAYKLSNFNRGIKFARMNALVAYHNAAREANNANANAVDLANTSNTNVYADAATMVANMKRSTDTSRENMDLTMDNNDDNYLEANYTAGIIVSATNQTNDRIQAAANSASIHTTATTNERTMSTTDASAFGDIISSATQGAYSGAIAGGLFGTAVGGIGAAPGAVAGALVGFAGGAVSAIVSHNNAVTLTGANVQTTNAHTAYQNTNVNENNSLAQGVTTETLLRDKHIKDNNNETMDAQEDNNYECNNANAEASAQTAKDNSDRTTTTLSDNAGYTREVAILNAKETLENTRNLYLAPLYDSRNARPIKLCDYSGDSTSDYMQTRGVQYKIKTMNDSEVSQTGDFFARYGYSLNQNWDIQASGLILMKNFTYWKATDIWVDDMKDSNNFVQLSLSKIFMQGTTVWSNPEIIGKVGIYDN